MGHVRKSMFEELQYFCDKVWEAVPLAEAQSDPEGKIIGSRWVNCNKNDINDPDVRCRLVAQEVNVHADESFYAATPPLEAKRLLFSQWASEQERRSERLHRRCTSTPDTRSTSLQPSCRFTTSFVVHPVVMSHRWYSHR